MVVEATGTLVVVLLLLVVLEVAVLIVVRLVPHLLQPKVTLVVVVALQGRKHQVVVAVLEQSVLMLLAVRLVLVEQV